MCSCSLLTAQELPPINTYTSIEYGAESQNWSISQSENNYIYVANNKGLLEFNGENWRLYPTPNETIMRSVKVFKDKIYTGFYMNFGYWETNDFGALVYISINKKEKIPLLEDESFWNIIELDGWMLFQSHQRIYLYNLATKQYKIIPSDSKIVKMMKVNDTIYFQKQGVGIFKIENGKATLVSKHRIFRENDLIAIFENHKKLLFLTLDKGFFLINNSRVIPWNVPANKKIRDKGISIYHSIQLKNKDFVLGTISNGLVYITKEGFLKHHITQKNGLSDNTVLSVFEDNSNTIWLALDNGINNINISSEFRTYLNTTGTLGTIYTSIRKGNYLYLGTNQGLFYKKVSANSDFTFVENTQGQVWNLTNIDNEILCGHNLGTFSIQNGKATKIIDVQGTWDIKPIGNGLYLQGNYDGLNIIQKVNNRWSLRNKLAGFNISSRFFELLNPTTIFVNHEYKGVFKLHTDANLQSVQKVERVASISKGLHSSLMSYHDNILYASKKGIFSFDTAKNKFIKDTVLSKILGKETYSSGRLIFNASNNLLWAFSEEYLMIVSPGKLSNQPVINSVSISKNLNLGATGFENVSHYEDQKYLIGGSDGYSILDLNKIKKQFSSKVYLNSVKKNVLNDSVKQVSLTQKGAFKNAENNIYFSFNTPNFDRFSSVKYQYQLLGNSPLWSRWTDHSSVFYEKLPSGEYTFKVRAKIDGIISDNSANFSFSIDKKWYLTNTMLVIYVLLIVLISFFTHSTYRWYYNKKQALLLEKASSELALKELSAQQEIMRLRNEKLKNDIASKSKELASSTMSIIKKNEFLSSLKKELTVTDGKNLKKVIAIIDKNLNNTDDWKLFQEAFNNADKKFLKKVKKLHPTLTPNDLRLCAYLRLNLSSKEIAPLLNISPRSVEVKRYRLRKKMDLPHEFSLTNYIIEI